VFGWMHVSIGGNGEYLELEKQLKQGTRARCGLRERADRRVEIELGRFATMKCGLCVLLLLGREPQQHEDLLDNLNFIPGDDPIGLAERPHDGKGRFQELILNLR
jgi:hypothetical protein